MTYTQELEKALEFMSTPWILAENVANLPQRSFAAITTIMDAARKYLEQIT